MGIYVFKRSPSALKESEWTDFAKRLFRLQQNDYNAAYLFNDYWADIGND